METEIATHQAAQLIRLHAKHGIFERLHHGATRKPAQAAALGRRARILRILFGKRTEVGYGAILLQLGQHLIGTLPGGRHLCLPGIGGDVNQDMARLALLRLTIVIQIPGIRLTHLFITDTDLVQQGLLAQHHIIHTHPLGCLELCVMAVVIGLDSFWSKLHLCQIISRAQQHFIHITHFLHGRNPAIGGILAGDTGQAHGRHDLLQRNVQPQATLELLRTQALRGHITVIQCA